MQPSTWDRLEAVFFEALALPAEERPGFLDRACAGDPELRAEIDALLAAHLAFGDDDAEPGAPEGRVGTRIGAYRLDALIGRGGMGEVYSARRADEQYEHEVAIKIVRSGLSPFEMVRRFRQERQILARLEHPNVATLLDGGVTAEGQPYLVMQYVRGKPITEYVDARRLGIPERLRLFITVCRTVQFAHVNLVVHRDLKPSNIMVSDNDQVRLLDFGISKLLDTEGTTATLPTESLLLLTPEHAAPEQFLGQPITTATDVYQLGVLLYQLLTGARPFQAGTSVELSRAICEAEPTRPSAALGRSADGKTDTADTVGEADAARVRATTPDGLRRQLRGDLDRIVLMALRKDPARRYGSAADLADDIERHLGGFPVRARPESRGYVIGRFVRRHRIGVAAGAALAASLVALLAVSLRFASTTSKQATAIAAERDVAVQVSGFLENLFAASDPYAAAGNRRDTLRVGAFLEDGTRKVRNDLKNQPRVQARLFTVLGKAWRNLGRYEEATPLLQEAVAIRQRTDGAESPDLGIAQTDLAQLLDDQGKLKEAEEMVRSSIAILERDSMKHSNNLSLSWSVLGNVFQEGGRYPAAESAYRHALALSAHDTASNASRAEKLANLATILGRQAKIDEAATMLREAVDLSRKRNGSDHPMTATMLNNLGAVLSEGGDFAGAEAPYREALAIRRARFEAPHREIAVSINNLADLLMSRKDPAGAEPLFRESLAMRKALFGEVHPAVGIGFTNLAMAQMRLGKREEALGNFQQALKVLLATVGPNHPVVASVEGNLGGFYHEGGDHAAALTHFRAALDIRRRVFDAKHPNVLGNLSDIGQCLGDLKRYKEAEVLLLEAYQGLEPQRQKQARMFNNVLLRLGTVYRAMGRADEAAKYDTMRKASG